jgi:cell wall-associated NlpC family hydrolase
MEFGITLTATLPCRQNPSHKSELINQLLFGETYQVLDKDKDWLLIKTNFDNYEGWINENQADFIDENEINRMNSELQPHVVSRMYARIENSRTGIVYPILRGSTLPLFSRNKFSIGEDYFEVSEYEPLPKLKNNTLNIINSALTYLNSPYLWGGRSPFGLDCSGFIQMIHKINGVKLPRDSSQQANIGTTINFVEEAIPGDVAFFNDTDSDTINHVGLILEEGMIIHASGKVKIGKIDHNGIFDMKLGKYTHHLRKIQRVI